MYVDTCCIQLRASDSHLLHIALSPYSCLFPSSLSLPSSLPFSLFLHSLSLHPSIPPPSFSTLTRHIPLSTLPPHLLLRLLFPLPLLLPPFTLFFTLLSSFLIVSFPIPTSPSTQALQQPVHSDGDGTDSPTGPVHCSASLKRK